MKALAVMPWTCSPLSVVMTVTPVANMPERPAQGDGRVVAFDVGEVGRLGFGDLVEGLAPIPSGPAQLSGKSNSAAARADCSSHERGRVLSGS